MGDGGELERALDDVFGIKVTVRSCRKSCSISNGKLLPNLSSSCLFLSAFNFHQPRKFPGYNLSLKKGCRGKPRQFSKRGLDRSQMGQPIKKNKFSFFARSRLLGTRLVSICSIYFICQKSSHRFRPIFFSIVEDIVQIEFIK